jgi:FMN phosphatase YigB (HAD superfamily)
LTPKNKIYEELRARIDLDQSFEEFLASYDVRYPTYFESDPSMTAALLLAREAGWRIAVVTNGHVASLLGEQASVSAQCWCIDCAWPRT